MSGHMPRFSTHIHGSGARGLTWMASRRAAVTNLYAVLPLLSLFGTTAYSEVSTFQRQHDIGGRTTRLRMSWRTCCGAYQFLKPRSKVVPSPCQTSEQPLRQAQGDTALRRASSLGKNSGAVIARRSPIMSSSSSSPPDSPSVVEPDWAKLSAAEKQAYHHGSCRFHRLHA